MGTNDYGHIMIMIIEWIYYYNSKKSSGFTSFLALKTITIKKFQ